MTGGLYPHLNGLLLFLHYACHAMGQGLGAKCSSQEGKYQIEKEKEKKLPKMLETSLPPQNSKKLCGREPVHTLTNDASHLSHSCKSPIRQVLSSSLVFTFRFKRAHQAGIN